MYKIIASILHQSVLAYSSMKIHYIIAYMTRRKPMLLVYYKKYVLYVAEATNYIHKLYTAYTREI